MKGFIELHDTNSYNPERNLILLNVANIAVIEQDGTIRLSSGNYYDFSSIRESYNEIVDKIKKAMEEK